MKEGGGYAEITLSVPLCTQCRLNHTWLKPTEVIKELTVCLSAEDYQRAQLAAAASSVMDSKRSIHNGGIQMANMRYHGIKDGGYKGEKEFYHIALAALWPYVASCMTSTETVDDGSSFISQLWYDPKRALCCYDRSRRRLVKTVFWPGKNDVCFEDLSRSAQQQRYDAQLEKMLTFDEFIKAHSVPKSRHAPAWTRDELCDWWKNMPLHPPSLQVAVSDEADKFLTSLLEKARKPTKISGAYILLDHVRGKMACTGDEEGLGIVWGPDNGKCFYDKSPFNLVAGFKARYDDVVVPVTLSAEDTAEIKEMVETVCKEIREDESIDKIAMTCLFGQVTSKKWSERRAEEALSCLLARWEPHYQFTASIKVEPMAPTKAPRCLIADGDMGAMASALNHGVAERWFCGKRFKHVSIKGKAKNIRLAEIVAQTRFCKEMHSGARSDPVEGFVLENDGSAWDACCSLTLRNLVENPIMSAIYERTSKYIVPYGHTTDARRKADRQAVLNLRMKCNKPLIDFIRVSGMDYKKFDIALHDEPHMLSAMKQAYMKRLPSIRRSGDRGTSLLNFILNLLLWVWVLSGKHYKTMLQVSARKVRTIFSVDDNDKRHFYIWIEGDDSLIWLSGKCFSPQELDVLQARWVRCGMRPKLFLRTHGQSYNASTKAWEMGTNAEFVGWKFVVDKCGLVPGSEVPDVPRMLANVFYSSDRALMQAAIDGDEQLFAKCLSPALIARSMQFAETCPTIARWLLQLAFGLHPLVRHDPDAIEYSRDDLFRMGSNPDLDSLPELWVDYNVEEVLDQSCGTFLSRVQRDIAGAEASGGLEREAALMLAHGWVSSREQWDTFAVELLTVTKDTTYDQFRALLPPGLR